MSKEILHIKNLSIGYQQSICEGINARVRKGELVGLVGRNGAGKSTLIRSILGLQKYHSGKVLIHSEDVRNWSIAKRAKNVAVVFSRLNQLPAIPVADLLALGRLPYSNGFSKLSINDRKKIQKTMELVGMAHLKNKMLNQLSDGQLQMVMIARALVQDTDLVVMDEPTSHLDIENQFKVFELIYKLTQETQKTFIVATHEIELVLQNATQLWWIDKGEFHSGFPEQLAFEQNIYEKLSQKIIKFDYSLGSFRFQYPKNKKIKWKANESKLAYWTKHALERKGYQFSENANNKIEIIEDKLTFNNIEFKTIESLIKHLDEDK